MAGIPILEFEWHQNVRLQTRDAHRIEPVEPVALVPVGAGMCVVMLTGLVEEADLEIRQAGLAALGVEGQSVADGLADEGDPVAACVLDESGGGDGGGKRQRIGEYIDVATGRYQVRQRVREMPGVGVVAAAVA